MVSNILSPTQQKLRYIRETIRGIGTRAPVVNAVDMLCDLIEVVANAQLRMLEVQNEVPISLDPEQVSKPEVPVTKNKGSLKAGKGSKTSKTKGKKAMSTDESPKVISSAAEAAAAIKKEKEDKQKMLDKIFSDNETGRYSGPTDA